MKRIQLIFSFLIIVFVNLTNANKFTWIEELKQKYKIINQKSCTNILDENPEHFANKQLTCLLVNFKDIVEVQYRSDYNSVQEFLNSRDSVIKNILNESNQFGYFEITYPEHTELCALKKSGFIFNNKGFMKALLLAKLALEKALDKNPPEFAELFILDDKDAKASLDEIKFSFQIGDFFTSNQYTDTIKAYNQQNAEQKKLTADNFINWPEQWKSKFNQWAENSWPKIDTRYKYIINQANQWYDKNKNATSNVLIDEIKALRKELFERCQNSPQGIDVEGQKGLQEFISSNKDKLFTFKKQINPDTKKDK